VRAFLVTGLLVLSACGFEPLYRTADRGAETEQLLSRIEVPPIADRLGQLVRTVLNDRLKPRAAPQPLYAVVVTLTESTQGLAVRRDASATRANLIVNATFTLSDISGGENLLSGKIRSVNGYDILTSDFATLAAEKDARRRGARDVADAIFDRLAIYMSRVANQAPAGR
jgi:LPS-assembly lipoprotein